MKTHPIHTTPLLLLVALVLTSCETMDPALVKALGGTPKYPESIGSTSQYYRPLTTRIYPPKPKDYKIRIYDAPPKEKHEVIGRMKFSAGYGYDFMIKAIEYNARQNGADAVIMNDTSSKTKEYTYTVPPSTYMLPVTSQSSGSAYGTSNYHDSYGYSGYGSTSVYGSGTTTTRVPVYKPGYTATGSTTRHHIDASMIVFK